MLLITCRQLFLSLSILRQTILFYLVVLFIFVSHCLFINNYQHIYFNNIFTFINSFFTFLPFFSKFFFSTITFLLTTFYFTTSFSFSSTIFSYFSLSSNKLINDQMTPFHHLLLSLISLLPMFPLKSLHYYSSFHLLSLPLLFLPFLCCLVKTFFQ